MDERNDGCKWYRLDTGDKLWELIQRCAFHHINVELLPHDGRIDIRLYTETVAGRVIECVTDISALSDVNAARYVIKQSMGHILTMMGEVGRHELGF